MYKKAPRTAQTSYLANYPSQQRAQSVASVQPRTGERIQIRPRSQRSHLWVSCALREIALNPKTSEASGQTFLGFPAGNWLQLYEGDYLIMHPLGYFASAPDGTNDSLILRDIEEQIGSYSENLSSEDKLAFLAVLSRYLYFKQWVIPDYSIGEAIADSQIFADTTPDTEAARADTTPETDVIWDILLTLEGISLENALGLLQFITVTEKHCERARTPAATTCFNCTPDQLVWAHEESASVIDPGCAWLLLLPKDRFTMPKFSFGQSVQSRSRETIGRIIGMEFVPSGSHYISCGWRYVIAMTPQPDFRNWGNSVDSFPEADLIIICGG